MLHTIGKDESGTERGGSYNAGNKETHSNSRDTAAATSGHGESNRDQPCTTSKKRNAAGPPSSGKLERKKPARVISQTDSDIQIARHLKNQQQPPPTNQRPLQTGVLPLPRSTAFASRDSSQLASYRPQQPDLALLNNRNPFLASGLARPDLGSSLSSLISHQTDTYLQDPQVANFLQLQAMNRIQQQNLLRHDLTSSALRLSQSIGGYDAQQWSMTANRCADPSLTAAALGFSPLRQNFTNHNLFANGLPMYIGEPTFQNRLSSSLMPGTKAGNFKVSSDVSMGIPMTLPCILARPDDSMKLSSHQVLLRHQIEAFQATKDDVTTHTRGRNKPITLGQVGIRCRHCSYLPVARRQKGSTYFPATTQGIYQAAQNMSTTHMQCGLCNEMPDSIKQEFARLLCTKATSSGAGRPYWAKAAKQMGLVDTENGIRFIRDLAPGSLSEQLFSE